MMKLFGRKQKGNTSTQQQPNQFVVRNAKDFRAFQYHSLINRLGQSEIVQGRQYQGIMTMGSYRVNTFIITNPQDGVLKKIETMNNNHDLPMMFGIGKEELLRISYVQSDKLGHRSSITIEVPKPERFRKQVNFRDVVSGIGSNEAAIGMNTHNRAVLLDYSDPVMAHVLVGGATGSGKTNTMKVMSISTMQGYKPGEAYFIFIDLEKGITEWGGVQGCALLGCPVITKPEQAMQLLSWLMIEKAKRYDSGDTSIFPPIYIYTDEVSIFLNGEKALVEMFADLHATGRGAGIYFISGTQNGNKDVLGDDARIKGGMTTRIVGSVASPEESKTLTGKAQIGAESLQEKGDFIMVRGGSQRIAVPFVHANFWDNLPKGIPDYLFNLNGNIDPNVAVAQKSARQDIVVEDLSALQAAKSLDQKLLSLCLYIQNKQGKPMGATMLSKISKDMGLNGKNAKGEKMGYSPQTIQEYQKIAKFVKSSGKQVQQIQDYYELNPNRLK